MNKIYLGIRIFFHQQSYARDNRVIGALELRSMLLIATSMSTQRVLAVQVLQRVGLFVL